MTTDNAMMRRLSRWFPHPVRLVASLAVVLALVVPAAYVALPHVHRWHTLNGLTHRDDAVRERALNYVIRRAGDDPAVRDGAIARLMRVERRAHFIPLTNALDHAGVWSRRYVPDGPWLRWLDALAESDEPRTRRLAARRLSELTDLADDAAVRDRLEALLGDDEPLGRRDALRSVALVLGHVDAPSPYHRLIAGRAGDADAGVARDAWMLIGLIGPIADRQANWRAVDDEVAAAMLWAAVRVAPARPQAPLDALHDDDARPSTRAMAVYALDRARGEAVAVALRDVLASRPIPRDEAQRVIVQRAILAHPDADALPALICDELDADDVRDRSLRLACAYRLAEPLLAIDDDADGALMLASVENVAVGARDIPVTLAHPAAVRLAALARTASPDVTLINDLFSHASPTMRDLACTVAADRLDDDQLDELVLALLTDLNPTAREAGAVLAGLTGLHTDLLRERAERERAWRTRTMMRLGLWMQGELDEMARQIDGLLTRQDLPRSTLLLALLHRRDARGLDMLLAPHDDPPPDLHRLLVHYRWWHVLAAHLPDDAPPLWLWADADLQRFQIEALRHWYRLNRHDLLR